jgi:hypothetical protein
LFAACLRALGIASGSPELRAISRVLGAIASATRLWVWYRVKDATLVDFVAVSRTPPPT